MQGLMTADQIGPPSKLMAIGPGNLTETLVYQREYAAVKGRQTYYEHYCPESRVFTEVRKKNTARGTAKSSEAPVDLAYA